MAETTTKNDELRSILNEAKKVFSDSEKVKEKVQELLPDNESRTFLGQIHPAIARLDRAQELVTYYVRGTNLESAELLENKMSELLSQTTVSINRRIGSKIFNDAKDSLTNVIKLLDVFESELNSPFDYEFSPDEINEIKAEIKRYLEEEYFNDIEITIPNKINGISEITFSKTAYVNYNDQFDGVFSDLIEENKLTKKEVLEWLYENFKDVEWYEEEVNVDEVRSKIKDYIESLIPHIRNSEIQRFVDNVEILPTIDLTDVAKRIVEDLDAYCTHCDDLLTIESLRSSERLRDLIENNYDYLYCSKQFADPEIFEYVPFSNISEGIAYFSDKSSVAKKIVDKIKSDPDYQDYGEEELSEMIYSYVEDTSTKELGSIIREDKELTLEIVGEDNLFEANGIWVFYSMY